MPFINTTINVSVTAQQKEQLKSKLGAAIELLDKNECWLMLNIEGDKSMYFKGESDCPMAFVDISVFGKSTDQNCEKMTKELCKVFNDVLGISPDKLYVKYSGTTQWGWNNMNF